MEWCAGMPLAMRRPLDEGERRRLGDEARRLRWRGWGVVLLYPVLAAAFALAAARSHEFSPLSQGILAVGAILLFALCLPVQILVARDAFARSRGLSQDRRCGFIKRYAGELDARAGADQTLLLLRRARLIPADSSGEWSIEVLPASRRVWRVRDRSVAGWIVARAVEVADTPEVAAIAAQWLEPAGRIGNATLLGGQRELSGAEREELCRYARRLWLRPLPWAIGLTLWLSMPVAVLIVEGNLHSRGDWIRFALLALATLWMDAAFLRGLWVAGRLRRDAAAGHVMILRPEPGGPPPPEGEAWPPATGAAGPDAEEPVTLEVLPFSHWLWTEDSRPASWRKVCA
jgi:hypothetical protein